ncbi:DNA-binding protein [Paenibacillus sp. WLX2291]|uniref:DNA-binding protein n=1 Tax=Paenibacillus sp. WLX2291 TaxID=3296934 RepID=UPI0039842978
MTGINRGTLSSIFNHYKPKLPSVIQLDKITKALGYEEGYFYDSYIEEYFAEFTPHWRKLKPLLKRCVELEFISKIERILDHLMEQSNQTTFVFELAESWIFDKSPSALIPFYEYVIKNEKYRHNENLAISRYRIFQLQLKYTDFDSNIRAAIQFENYRDELPVDYKLDALLELINIYFNHHDYEKIGKYADELNELVLEVYNQRLHMKMKKDGSPVLNLQRHLVVYYGQSYLSRGTSLEEMGNYKQALEFPPKYADLSWFEGLDDIGRLEVEKFKTFAYANDLTLRVLMGQTDKIPEYIQFLKLNPGEILNGFITLFKVEDGHNIPIQSIFDEFLDIIIKFENDEAIEGNYYNRSAVLGKLETLYRHLAIYHFKQERYAEGVRYLSKCLTLANQINKKSEFNEYPELMNILKEWSLLMERNHKNDPG